MDCGAILGTVEFKRAISLDEAQTRANCYRCGACADLAQAAEAKCTEDRAAALARLLADAENASTIETMRDVLRRTITHVTETPQQQTPPR